MKRIEIAIALFFSAVILFSCKNSNNENEAAYEEPEMDGVELAIQQEISMTRDPQTNTVPAERLVAANSYMKNLQQARLTSLDALTWAERGPNNVGGRTRAIMIDERDGTGNTVFAGSVGGGLFKSTNFTSPSASWTPVNDFLPNLAITCLLQDRTNGAIMYAGTGEGWFNIDGIRGNGIYKSTDGGTTWNVLASTVKTTPSDSTFEFVQDLAQDSIGNIYASLRNQSGFARGVKRSNNGGASWVQVLGAPLIGFNTGRAGDIEVAANGDVYASLGLVGAAVTNRSVVMKSSFATNGANTGSEDTWVDITPIRGLVTQRTEIAVAPSNAQRVYLLMQDSATDQVIGIYRSFNGGTVWDSIPSAPALNNGVNSQAWYDLIAAVDPNNADVLIVGGLNLAKSTNAGAADPTTVTWTTIGTNLPIHVDQHALVFNGSSKIISGNDGGIFYSNDVNTATPTFTNKNNGFNCTQYYGVDLHPTNANYFLAGAQDNGTQKFISPGINTTTSATGGDGGWPHIDQNNGGLLQITSNTGNRYNFSNNGGVSFALASGVLNNRGQFINPTDFDDQNDVLYCGDDPGQYFYITNWATIPIGTIVPVAGFGSREVTFVKVDPTTPTTVWMGLSPTIAGIRPMIAKLTNANSTSPVLAVQGLVGTINGASVSAMDIDPVDNNHIIATLSNYGVPSVWESTDGGATFINNIEGNLPDMPVWWCMFAPPGGQLNGPTGGNGGIILATETGIWTTSAINGTSTQWIPNSAGMANVSTYMIKYRPSDNTLVAATHGRGLFTTTLTIAPLPPANDDCAGATTLTSAVSCSNTTGTLVNATASTGIPAGCAAAGVHNDVWYKFVATNTTHTVTISGQGASVTNPEIQLYSGTCGSLTSIACGTTTLTSSLITIGATYFIRVSNIGSSPTTNGGFSICVTNPTPPPANDDCAGAITLTTPANCSNTTGTLINTTASTGIPAGCAAAGVHNDVWYKFVATGTTHTVTISGQGANVTNPEIQLYSGTCGSLTSIICGTTTLTSSLLSVGATYYIRVSNIGSSPTSNGGFSICVTNPAPTGVPNIPNTKDFIKYISVENNQLQVAIGNLQTQNMTMQLFDMNGRLLMQRRQRYENVLLDLSRYTSGSYILKIMGDKNERFIRQVVK